MPNVYVVGAQLPSGGAFMAYHVGRLLSRFFDYELYDVELQKPERQLFEYDIPITIISKEEMENRARPDDILVVNPSYSEHLFGLRLPCRKIMYVQGFRRLLVMDCHCDLYVSVSQMVQRHIHTLFGISSPVIPAFVQLDKMPKTKPWHQRPPGSILICAKDGSEDLQNLYRYIFERLQHKAPDIDITTVLDGRTLSRHEFLQAIGSVRYIINLSLAEGFGLIPLEAMAMGTTVLGLDGLGGRDYMRSGFNCLVESMDRLSALPDTIIRAVHNESLAAACAENGRFTASHYAHPVFKHAWLHLLSQFLGRHPHHA